MPGERRKLARIAGLVQREDDDGQARVVAMGIQQRLQRADIIGLHRNVGALVAAMAVEERAVVIAERAGMDLQDEPVIEAHPRHLRQHLTAEQLMILSRPLARDHLVEQRLGLGRIEVGGKGGGVAMVRRGRPDRLEVFAALAVGGEIALPVTGILARDLCKLVQRRLEALMIGIDDRIRAIGRDDAPAPARRLDGLVMVERVGRAFGRSQKFDIEPVEKRTGPVGIRLERVIDRVVIGVRGGCIQRLGQPEDIAEHIVQPHAGRCAPEEIVILREGPPGLARIGAGLARLARHPQRIEAHALAVQHAVDVMIRRKEEFGRIAERGVIGKPGRVRMPVRADDRQVPYLPVEPSRNGPLAVLGREQAVLVYEFGTSLKRVGHGETSVRKP